MKKRIKFFWIGAISLCMMACIGWQSADVFAEDGEDSFQPDNGIPLVIIRVDESEATIDDMNNSYHHKISCDSATMEIKVPEGYTSPYVSGDGQSVQVPEGEIPLNYIRGRGNSTWECPKKPYKIELNGKQDLFGMGASEDWALLANYYDGSLIRNRITFWLGEQLGFAFSPGQIPVDLILYGSKTGPHIYGSYCLSETVKVEDSRVNIDKLKKNDSENITGGYLLSGYSTQDMDEPASTVFTTKYGLQMMNDTPDYDDTKKPLTEAQEAQRTYIRDYVQELEDLIMSPGEIDSARHERIDQKLDLKSAADYWWIQELSFNTDGFGTSSTYYYKERDGKLYFGPLWDFDYGWNNNGLWKETNETFNNTAMIWIDALRDKDPQFARLLQERWVVINDKLVEMTKEKTGLIDTYAEEIRQSQASDWAIWQEGANRYDDTIDQLRTWTEKRRAWADENIDKVNEVFCTVTYEADGKTVATERVRFGEHAIMDPDAPVVEGKVFNGWKEKETGKTPTKVTVREDVVFVPIYVNESEAVAPEKLIIDIPDEIKTVDVATGFFPVIDPMGGASLDSFAYVEPYDATNQRITWTSSNEKVGEIDPVNKRVILKRNGVTTITGTLYNNVSASFELTITGTTKPVVKYQNPLEVKGKTAKVKYKKLKKKAQKLDVSKVIEVITPAEGDMSYVKKGGNKKITINKKTGKVKIKKGLKKGTFKVTVNVQAAGDDYYQPSDVQKVVFKVRVK